MVNNHKLYLSAIQTTHYMDPQLHHFGVRNKEVWLQFNKNVYHNMTTIMTGRDTEQVALWQAP